MTTVTLANRVTGFKWTFKQKSFNFYKSKHFQAWDHFTPHFSSVCASA